MSQHPSLRGDDVSSKHRNVLKRYERIKTLQEQNKWEDRNSVFGLPKVKSLKVKVKKIKDETKEGAEAGAVTGSATTAAGAAAKGAAPAKPKGATAAQKTDKK